MRIYVLQFDSASLLTRAFDRIIASERVASCMVESERRRLRFLAPQRVADALVERVYLEGGLTWCTRHDVGARDSRAPTALHVVR